MKKQLMNESIFLLTSEIPKNDFVRLFALIFARERLT